MSRILLIEPDAMVAKNVSQLAQRAGHKIDWTIDAQAAVDLADDHKPDAVILELMLAGRSGVEFLYEFRSYPEWRDVPVIIYSNLSEQELPVNGSCYRDLGIARYFYKPLASLSHLIDEVSWLAHPVLAEK